MPDTISTITIDAKDVLAQATLVVKMTRLKQWRVRVWIAMRLIALAAWVAWMDVEFEEYEPERSPKCRIIE